MMLPLVLALSISSEKIDTFMHVPDWMPTEVAPSNTFGSSEHTNASRRVTADTLAAAESVFDAYHERVLFASEARNVYAEGWDTSVYGPRLSLANGQQVWFTNTLEGAEHACYAYPFATNGWQRAVPDTRRLVEFDNLRRLGGYIPKLFRRQDVPFLFKGDTWGTNRLVMFGSSWGPSTNDIPQDTSDWIVGDLTDKHVKLGSQLVPLCYLKPDTYFVTSSPADRDYGLLYELLTRNDRHFNILNYHVEDSWGYVDEDRGLLGEWMGGKWRSALWMSNSVPSVITNRFPDANPEFAMTNFTRRLLPDDYVFSATISTSYWVKVDSVTKRVDLTQARTNGTERYLFSRIPVGFSSTLNVIYGYVFKTNVLSKIGLSTNSEAYPFDELYGAITETCFPTSKDYDRYEVLIGGDFPNGIYWYSREEGLITRYIYTWEWTNPIAEITVDYYKFVVETNVVNASSLVATESRALAMLDRTYEVPLDNGVTNGPRKVNLTRFRADYISEMREVPFEITGPYAGPLNLPITPVGVDDFGFTAEPIYQTSNQVEELVCDGTEDQFRGEYSKFSGVDDFLQASVVCTNHYSRVLVRLDEISGMATPFDFAQDTVYDIVFDDPRIKQDWSYDVWVGFDEGGRRFYNVWFDMFNDKDSFRFKARGQFRATLIATHVESQPLPDNFIQRITWPVGPGVVGRYSGVVANSRVVFFDELLERYAKRDAEGYPEDDYLDEWRDFSRAGIVYENTLPWWRPTYQDPPEEQYNFTTRFRIGSESVNDGMDALTKIQDRLLNLNATVHSLLVERLGVGPIGTRSLTAQDVVPVRPLGVTFSNYTVKSCDVGIRFNRLRDISFMIPSGSERPVFFDKATGETVSGSDPIPLLSVTYGVDLRPDTIRGHGLKPAVSVSARTSPVIVTDWDWKALKTERNNQ